MCSICLSNNAEDLINDFEELSSDELNLAKELKSRCELYGDKWKEKEPKESENFFHKLGLLYKNKCFEYCQNSLPNKRKFIQSAALLNCALERQPLSKEIKEDLQILCLSMLESSKAQLQDFDLVEFASNLKQEIEQWRNDLKGRINASLPIAKEGFGNNLK